MDFPELLVIFALALVVLGPEKLPKLAQQVGRWVGRARAMARQFRDQLEEEAHNLETKVNIDPGIDTSLDPKPPPLRRQPLRRCGRASRARGGTGRKSSIRRTITCIPRNARRPRLAMTPRRRIRGRARRSST